MDFVKRPLAVMTLTTFISFCIFANLGTRVTLYQPCIFGILSLVFVCLSFIPIFNKKFSLWLRYAFLIAAGFFFSLLLILVSFSGEEQALYSGKELNATCTLTDVLWESETDACYKAQITRVDEAEADFAVALETSEKYEVGGILSAKVYFSELESGGAFDEKRYYMSKGMIMIGEVNEADVVGNAEKSLFSVFKELNAKLSQNMEKGMSKDSGNLATAVVLGNKSELSAEIKRDFSKIGIAHLIAVSGMHISFIFTGFHGITRKLRIGRKTASFMCIFLMLFYMGLTGFSASVVRAALLCCLMSLMVILGIGHDGITALGICGCCMITVCPHFAFDMGMQLSFSAYAGCLAAVSLEKRILGFISTQIAKAKEKKKPVESGTFCKSKRRSWFEKSTRKSSKHRKQLKSYVPRKKSMFSQRLAAWLKKPGKNLFKSVLFTLTVTAFALPVMWLYYDSISIIAPLANLVFIPLFSVIMYLGIAVMLLSPVPYVGATVSFAADKFISFVLFLSEKAAEHDNITVSLNYSFSPYIIVLMLVCLIVAVCAARKPAAAGAVGLCLCVILYGTGVFAHRAYYEDTVTVSRIDSRGGDGVIICSEGTTVLCDISKGSSSEASLALYQASELCETEIDVLILTRYESGHLSLVSKLSENTYLKTAYLAPATGTESLEIRHDICTLLEDAGVRVYTLPSYPESLTVEDCCLSFLRETDGGVCLFAEGKTDTFLFLSSDFENDARVISLIPDVGDCHILFGKGTDTKTLKNINPVFVKAKAGALVSKAAAKALEKENTALELFPSYTPLTLYLK